MMHNSMEHTTQAYYNLRPGGGVDMQLPNPFLLTWINYYANAD